ncbi:MAG: alpha-ketoacid dehydrogenase subunit beta [Roseiflexaceae bacterium]|jgi:pyruvate dehydrogenase E1 component beta subunit|nr:alpha-ketoacid dehydrogenase subunit beta [Chloroflexaceae bacterium]MCE2852706.1 alpha-ketoacid dehydrogenase subunit beta [Chloroflexaceae bacterium]
MAVMTVREALQKALHESMADERAFIIGEDIGHYGSTYGVTAGFLEKYGPERIRDAPIAEAGILGVAIGAAMAGMRPIAEIMSVNFSLLAFDMIINHAAKIYSMFGGKFSVPLVMRTTNGWTQLSATHSQTFDAMFAHIPGLKVVAPATPADMLGLFRASMADPDPVIFIEHTLMYGVKGEVPDGDYVVPIGKSVLSREGRHITVVTYSRMVHLAHQAADILAQEGIEVEIVDLRTLRPLDMSVALESFKKTNRAVVVTEDWQSYGTSAEIATRLYEHGFDYLDAPIQRVNFREVPMPYAKNLEQQVVVTTDRIVAAIRKVLHRS